MPVSLAPIICGASMHRIAASNPHQHKESDMTIARLACAAVAALCVLAAAPAAASYDRHSYSGYSDSSQKVRHAKKPSRVERRVVSRTDRRHRNYVSRRAPVHRGAVHMAAAGRTVQYLPHPPGCPRRLFCGCGAAYEVFGRPVRSLWLARAWYKFPRTSPAPGTVAVRRHHVFVLRQHVAGDRWLVADHNSGGRRSRLHVRSIAGLTIVNPRAGLAAL